MRGLERAAKRRMIRLAGPFFPTRPATDRLDTVLLIRVDDRLGNLILLSPALTWLRERLPEARIGLVLSRAFAAIYEQDPRVDFRIVLDKDRQKGFFPIFVRDLRRVGAARADAALECSDRNAFSFNGALYARATRAPRRIGFASDLGIHYLTEKVLAPERGHAARDPLLLAGRLLGAEPPEAEECRPSLRLPPADPVWGAMLDRLAAGAEDRIVGMHVGGRGRKRWPLERFAEVARGLLDAGRRPWIFRGPLEEEDRLFEGMRPDGLVLVPRADVVRLGQAFSRCRLVIAPDTGPMHLAAAAGSRALALFLDSDLDRYCPLGTEHVSIDARGGDLPAARVLEEALRMTETAPRERAG